MKKYILIIAALLTLAAPAWSKPPLPDELLALITGQAGASPESDGAVMAAIPPASTDMTRETPGPAETAALTAGHDHLAVRPHGSGISIYVIDLLFDVYIGNIAWGDTDSSL